MALIFHWGEEDRFFVAVCIHNVMQDQVLVGGYEDLMASDDTTHPTQK